MSLCSHHDECWIDFCARACHTPALLEPLPLPQLAEVAAAAIRSGQSPVLRHILAAHPPRRHAAALLHSVRAFGGCRQRAPASGRRHHPAGGGRDTGVRRSRVPRPGRARPAARHAGQGGAVGAPLRVRRGGGVPPHGRQHRTHPAAALCPFNAPLVLFLFSFSLNHQTSIYCQWLPVAAYRLWMAT